MSGERFSPLTDVHGVLIEKLQKLGYKGDEGGICFGYAARGAEAIASGASERLDNLELFNRRIGFVMRTNIDDVVAAEQERDRRIAAVDDKYKRSEAEGGGFTIPYEELREKYKKARDSMPDKYKDALKRGSVARAFFESVDLYANAVDYGEDSEFAGLFDVAPTKQSILDSAPLAMSKAVEDQGGMQQLAKFTGVYSSSDLTQMLSAYRKSVEGEVGKRIALSMRSQNHIISIAYDTTTKEWLLIDANNPPTQRVRSDTDMGKAVIASFVDNPFAINPSVVIRTEAYATAEVAPEAQNYINQFQHSPEYEKIHDPAREIDTGWVFSSKKKVGAVSDALGHSWLQEAINAGDVRVTEALLKNKAYPEDVFPKDNLMLLGAINKKDLGMIKVLLENGADPNAEIRKGGKSILPLELAEIRGYKEVASLLRKHGAQLDGLTAGQVDSEPASLDDLLGEDIDITVGESEPESASLEDLLDEDIDITVGESEPEPASIEDLLGEDIDITVGESEPEPEPASIEDLLDEDIDITVGESEPEPASLEDILGENIEIYVGPQESEPISDLDAQLAELEADMASLDDLMADMPAEPVQPDGGVEILDALRGWVDENKQLKGKVMDVVRGVLNNEGATLGDVKEVFKGQVNSGTWVSSTVKGLTDLVEGADPKKPEAFKEDLQKFAEQQAKRVTMTRSSRIGQARGVAKSEPEKEEPQTPRRKI